MFCPIPWISMAVRNNGDIRVCCQANQGPDKGLLRKDNNDVYNAATDNLIDSRNCNKLKQIRLAFLNNKWHPDCIRCQREEASGIKSRLTYETENWAHHITEDKARNLTADDGSIDVDKIPLLYYDLRFGNKCNLKCRTCGPTDSSAWYEDTIKLWGHNEYQEATTTMKIIKKDNKFTVENNIYNWYEHDNFWEFINGQLHNINLVHMVGGEPLLINEHFKFLEMCVNQDHAKNIRIEYNTNGTILNKSIIDIWKEFKLVQIGVSIDGIYSVNDYIRYPSSWNNVYKNLMLLDDIGDNVVIWTSLTVNMLNLLHLPDYLNWLCNLKSQRMNRYIQYPFGALHPVHGPKFLNIKAFPKEIKEEIKFYFDNYVFDDHNELGHKILNKYIDFMFQEDFDPEMFSKFLHVTDKLDAIRNQKLQQSIPALYELIERYKNGTS